PVERALRPCGGVLAGWMSEPRAHPSRPLSITTIPVSAGTRSGGRECRSQAVPHRRLPAPRTALCRHLERAGGGARAPGEGGADGAREAWMAQEAEMSAVRNDQRAPPHAPGWRRRRHDEVVAREDSQLL